MKRNLSSLVASLVLAAAPFAASAQESPPPSPGAPPSPGMAPTSPEACPPGMEATTPPPQTYQQQPPMQTQVQQTTVLQETPRQRGPAYSPANQSLMIGGGVGNFVRDRIATQNSDVAAAWTGRYLLGTRTIPAFEADYIGTAAGGSSSLDSGSVVTNQVSGNFRLNLTRARVQPFLAAGVGWARLHRGSGGPSNTTGEISENVNSFQAPFSAGFSSYIGRHGLLDLRGTYSLITSKDFTNTGARPDMWSAAINAGYAF